MKIKKIFNTLNNYHLLAFLSLLIFATYSNSLNNSWHFDDYNNILENKNVHLTDIKIDSLTKSLYHWDNNYLYRPVACLSFAINWFIGKDIVTGYHLVNLTLHILTASFLYLVILNILSTPRLCSRFSSTTVRQYFAFIATVLWALHPIQTQAVTYIVQRMTILAGLFSILAIYVYIKTRLGQIHCKNIGYLAVIVLFVLAFGAKENSILLPGSLILVEIIFLRQKLFKISYNNIYVWIVSVLILITSLYYLVSFFLPGKLSTDLLVYEGRNFTLYERILTEPRVLIFYLSQIAYPLSSRLSLEHDIALSTSLFTPWTTLPAIVLIFIAVTLSFYKYKKYPLISFAVLFYFYNHIIESTILPLEIIFEHRNYLPSFFLFVPITVFLTTTAQRYSHKNSKLIYIINLFFVTLIVIFGLGTYSRNIDWKTEKSLLVDNIAKAPSQSRPYYNLAYYLLDKEKDAEGALALFKISLFKEAPSKHTPKYQSLIQISNILINYKNDYQSAIPIIREALVEKPDSLTPRKNLAISLIAVGELDEALHHIEILLKKRDADYKLRENEKISRKYLLNLKALVLLKQNSLSHALTSAKEAVVLDPDDPIALANLGLVLSKMGEYEEANKYLSKLYTVQKNPELMTFFLLLENSLRAKKTGKADEFAMHILLTFPARDVFSTLVLLDKPSTLQPVDSKILRPFLLQKLSKMGTSENLQILSSLKPLSKFSQ